MAHEASPRCSRVTAARASAIVALLRFVLLSPLMILTAHSDDARPFGNRNRVRAIAPLSQRLRSFTPALRSEADKNPRPSGARVLVQLLVSAITAGLRMQDDKC